MTYRVLAIGDPHFRKNHKEDGDSMREAILTKAREFKPDRIVVMGDLTHDHATVNQNPLKDATDFIYDLAEIAETEVLIGNHDLRNNSEFFSSHNPFTGVRNQSRLHIISQREERMISILEKRLILVPYVPDGRFSEACPPECYTGSSVAVAAIFCHQTFRGARYGGRVAPETADYWSPEAPLLISGHIHEYQWLAPNLVYVGTPMQHDFGDRSDKSLSLFTFFADGRPTVEERIRLGLRERQEVRLKVEEVYDWVPGPHRYKVYVSGTTPQVRLFFSSAKHRSLLASKVIVLEGELLDRSEPATPLIVTGEIPAGDYLSEVRSAIVSQARLMKWFDRICAE